MNPPRRKRADAVLVERNVFSSREKAQDAIKSGRVFIDRRPVTKASALVDPHSSIEVQEEEEYVSRGGHKLAAAFDAFNLSAADKTILDAGASTGGFTDYALKNGARKVIAIDVGYGQLAWSLRNDPRVEVHERTNIRYMSPGDVSEAADMVVVDLSFISVSKVLPAIMGMLKEDGEMVVLIKPQFEVEAGQVGKGGIVREPGLHKNAIEKMGRAAVSQGLKPFGLTYSPITGAEGNIEYLMLLRRAKVNLDEEALFSALPNPPDHVIAEAHKKLSKGSK